MAVAGLPYPAGLPPAAITAAKAAGKNGGAG